MLEYTVYWQVNDGRRGYPNIVAELSHGDYSNAGFRSVDSYENAIRAHGIRRGAYKPSTSSHYIIKETGRGRMRSANYRDYLVTYGAKDGGEDIQREVRVMCQKY